MPEGDKELPAYSGFPGRPWDHIPGGINFLGVSRTLPLKLSPYQSTYLFLLTADQTGKSEAVFFSHR